MGQGQKNNFSPLKISKELIIKKYIEDNFPNLPNDKKVTILNAVISSSGGGSVPPETFKYLSTVLKWNNGLLVVGYTNSAYVAYAKERNLTFTFNQQSQIFSYPKWKAQIKLSAYAGRLHTLYISKLATATDTLTADWMGTNPDKDMIQNWDNNSNEGFFFKMRYLDGTIFNANFAAVYKILPNTTSLIQPSVTNLTGADNNSMFDIIIRLSYDGTTFRFKITDFVSDSTVYLDNSIPYIGILNYITVPINIWDAAWNPNSPSGSATIMTETNW